MCFRSDFRSPPGFLRVLRFPPPVKLTFHDRHLRLDMTLAVAEALSPNKPNRGGDFTQKDPAHIFHKDGSCGKLYELHELFLEEREVWRLTFSTRPRGGGGPADPGFLRWGWGLMCHPKEILKKKTHTHTSILPEPLHLSLKQSNSYIGPHHKVIFRLQFTFLYLDIPIIEG